MRSTSLWVCVVAGCGSAPAPVSSSGSPQAPTQAPAAGQLCDIGDKIFVVDAHVTGQPVIEDRDSSTPLAGTVVAITRADGKRVDAPIDSSSVLVDNCGGTGGGHAGCSMSGGSSIHSGVLGSDSLFFGSTHRNTLQHGDILVNCRNAEEEDPSLDACATKSWYAVAGGNGEHPYLRVFAGADQEPHVQEPVALQDRRYAGKRAVLNVHDGGGTVELDGHSEPCLAVWKQ